MGSRREGSCLQLMPTTEPQEQVGEGSWRSAEPTSCEQVVTYWALPSGAGDSAAAASEALGEEAPQQPVETGRQVEAPPEEEPLLLMLHVQEVVEVVTQVQEEQ